MGVASTPGATYSCMQCFMTRSDTDDLYKCSQNNRGTEEAVSHTWLTQTADEFQAFVRSKGMKHIKPAPYHPNTNGMAERFVQTFKQALRTALSKTKTISRKLTNFLLACRTTPHALNGEAPVVLLVGRNLRTRLHILKLNIRSGGKTARGSVAEWLEHWI